MSYEQTTGPDGLCLMVPAWSTLCLPLELMHPSSEHNTLSSKGTLEALYNRLNRSPMYRVVGYFDKSFVSLPARTQQVQSPPGD